MRPFLLTLVVSWACFAPRVTGQPVAWEQLPLIPYEGKVVNNLDFWMGDGSGSPESDTLVAFGFSGTSSYDGARNRWNRLCRHANCGGEYGIISDAGTIYLRDAKRSVDRGVNWTSYPGISGEDFIVESRLPALLALSGGRPVFLGGGGYLLVRSLADGEEGSWHSAGLVAAWSAAYLDIPPSPALPTGRVLAGVGNGIVYSTDAFFQAVVTDTVGAFRPSSLYQPGAYITHSLTFLPVEGHPYGGTAFAGVEDFRTSPHDQAKLYRSDDGGTTWTLAHQFTPEETGLPTDETTQQSIHQVVVTAAPDGALWAGVNWQKYGPPPWPGRVMRSLDGGATWTRADSGMEDALFGGRGVRVRQLVAGRDGRLYAATDLGVWRTTASVVAQAEGPTRGAEALAVSVRPNPSSGAVTVVVSSSSTNAEATVVVFDALGRQVATVHAGPLVAGERSFALDTGAWAPGIYSVRAAAGSQGATVRFTVTR